MSAGVDAQPGEPAPDSLRLGTAGVRGAYHRAGREIQRAVAERGSRPIALIPTEGSVDNVHRLLSGEIDLAIVQNDVAFAAERGASPFGQRTDQLRGVLMLHPEPVYVFSAHAEVHWLRPPLPYRVGVGAAGSGLFFDARLLLQATGTWDPFLAEPVAAQDLGEALRSGRVGVGFTNTPSPEIEADVEAGALVPVSIPTDLLESITRTYPFFEPRTVAVGGDSVRTVAVRAMLVTRADVPETDVAAVVRAILPPGELAVLGADAPTQGMPLKAWHPGAEAPLSEAGLLRKWSWIEVASLLLVLGMVLVLGYGVLVLVLYAFGGRALRFVGAHSRWLHRVRRMNLVLLDHKYALVLVVMAALFVLDVLLVQGLERTWAIENGSASVFEQRGLVGNLLWMFVFTVSGYEDQLFPHSEGGKLFATLFKLIGVSGLLTLGGLLARDHVKEQILSARGLRTTTMKDHILVCGWNARIPDLVRALVHSNLDAPRPVVVLAETEEEVPLVAYGIDSPLVTFCKGCATRKQDLDRAGFASASTAIVVADDASTDPDAKTILKILTIESYSRELEATGRAREGRENIYTIAELIDPRSYETFAADARVDEIVPVGDIRTQILAQSALNHGVSSYLSSILTFNDDNDVYSHIVSGESRLVGQTFDDLLPLLRQQHVLLLAVRTAPSVNGSPDRSRIISNPIKAADDAYRTQPGDELIVLAQHAAHLRASIRAIEQGGI